jgi:hypothetical protein
MIQGNFVGSESSTDAELLAAYRVNRNRLAVKPSRGAGYRLIIDRSQAFSNQEHDLTVQFMEELAAVVALDAGVYEQELIRVIPRRVVARHLGADSGALLDILENLETWSSQTYEGQRIVACIGLAPDPAESGVDVARLWNRAYGPVLTNGYDTILVVGSDGAIAGEEELASEQVSPTAPYRLRQACCWAVGERVSLVLNQQGEILAFKDQSLQFARRAGKWVHYVHDNYIDRMYPPKDPALRAAIHESCLDVSFARSGGCIAVVNWGDMDRVSPEYVDSEDLLSNGKRYKNRLLSVVIAGRAFQDIDRRVRLELLSLDGAIVLDRYGRVISVGTIIDVPAGSEGGGGRTAAARRLSEIGLAVKVSQDGRVSAYRGRNEVFRV